MLSGDVACVPIGSTGVFPDAPEEHMNSFGQEICVRDKSMRMFPSKVLLPLTLALAVVRANIFAHLVRLLVGMLFC